MKSNFWTIKRILNYVVALVLFGFTLEVGARIDDAVSFDAPFFGAYSSILLRAHDEDGLRKNIPRGQFEKWKNNSLGFRGPEISLEKPEGIVRVACMGTSETYGLYESPDKEWPGQLREFLSDYSKFEVINTSTVGLPLVRYKDYIQRYVLPLSPDIIIIYSSPHSYLANRIRVENGIVGLGEIQGGARPSLPGNEFYGESRSVPKIRQMVRAFLPPSLIEWYDGYSGRKQIAAAEARYLRGEKPFDVIPDELLASYTQDITDLILFLQENNIRPILCNFPSLLSKENLEKYPGTFMAGRRFIVELSFEGMLDTSARVTKLNEQIALDLGIGFLDNDGIIPKDKDHFADNVHYTDTGAELVARTIADYLKINY